MQLGVDKVQSCCVCLLRSGVAAASAATEDQQQPTAARHRVPLPAGWRPQHPGEQEVTHLRDRTLKFAFQSRVNELLLDGVQCCLSGIASTALSSDLTVLHARQRARSQHRVDSICHAQS